MGQTGKICPKLPTWTNYEPQKQVFLAFDHLFDYNMLCPNWASQMHPKRISMLYMAQKAA